MLALIVEARFISRILSNAESFSTNSAARVVYALAFAITATLLFLGFLFALHGATGWKLVGAPADIVYLALVLGVANVVLTPTIQLTVALTGDQIAKAYRAMPFSKESRTERKKRRGRAEIARFRREFESVRLQSKIRVSMAYVALYQRERGVEVDAMWSDPSFTFESLKHRAAQIHAEVDRMTEALERADAASAANGKRLTDAERERFRTTLRQFAAG